MKAGKFRLLFFGSDKFSIRVLDRLLEKKLCPTEVVTRPGNLLDKFSTTRELATHRWPLSNQIKESKQFNIGLVASFGHLIDVQTINQFEFGLFNVHPSLLPQFRGSTPIQAAILSGQAETGCTIMKIPPVAKFDIGDIILQERLEIKRREYALDLADRLADLGSDLTAKLLQNYDDCLVSVRPQCDQSKSYARKIKPEQGMIDFKVEDSASIDRKIRAYTGYVEIYTFCLDGLKVRLEGLRDPREVSSYDLDRLTQELLTLKKVINENDQVSRGAIYFHKIRLVLCVKCADDKWLAFDYVTPEYKPKMTALEFYNGYLSKMPLRDMVFAIR